MSAQQPSIPNFNPCTDAISPKRWPLRRNLTLHDLPSNTTESSDLKVQTRIPTYRILDSCQTCSTVSYLMAFPLVLYLSLYPICTLPNHFQKVPFWLKEFDLGHKAKVGVRLMSMWGTKCGMARRERGRALQQSRKESVGNVACQGGIRRERRD